MTTIPEATARGPATVSFDSPHGPKGMITGEVDGLPVKPRANAGLAATLIRVIEDEELRHRPAGGAPATAATYDVESVGARWDALPEELPARRDGTYVKPAPAVPDSGGDEIVSRQGDRSRPGYRSAMAASVSGVQKA